MKIHCVGLLQSSLLRILRSWTGGVKIYLYLIPGIHTLGQEIHFYRFQIIMKNSCPSTKQSWAQHFMQPHECRCREGWFHHHLFTSATHESIKNIKNLFKLNLLFTPRNLPEIFKRFIFKKHLYYFSSFYLWGSLLHVKIFVMTQGSHIWYFFKFRILNMRNIAKDVILGPNNTPNLPLMYFSVAKAT